MKNQTDFFTSYIKLHQDWELVKIYTDEGISGTQAHKRKGFNMMINDCKNGKIDLILTKEVSRFARNTVDTLNYTRLLKSYNVYVIFINDNIDTRQNDGEFRLTIMAGIAQEESRKTSDRVKWGQRRAMEKGVVFGNNSLYGFDIDNGELKINENQAEIIRLIYHKFLNEHKGTHIIAKELTLGDIKPLKSDKWSSTMILRILRNEKYCGDLLQQKSVTTDFITHKRILNNTDDKVYIKDHHKAIIMRDIWQKVQTELDKRANNVKYSNKYWCSGKIVCSNCNKKFIAKKKRGYDYIIWVCDCGIHTVNSRVLTKCMEYILSRLNINKDKIVNNLIDEISGLNDTNNNLDSAELAKQISALETRKLKVLDSYFSGVINKDELAYFKEKYEFEINNLKSQNIQLTNNADPQITKTHRNLLIMSVTKSENVYSEILDKIIVHDKYLQFHFNGIDTPFKLHYTTRGYKNNYTVDIEEYTL